MKDVPVTAMRKGKAQNGGGDALDPGQVHSPPGAWPGSPPGPVSPPPSDWQVGEGDEDIVSGPLPALQKLAGAYASSLSATERLAFMRATVTRGQPLAEADLTWLLDYAEGRANRDRVVLAGLEAFYVHMRSAVTGNGPEQQEEETP